MAKRGWETERWKDPEWRRVPLEWKAIIQYFGENCDHAGIWRGDFELMKVQTGKKFTVTQLSKELAKIGGYWGQHVVLSNGWFFFPWYLTEQYGGRPLIEQNGNCQKSAVEILTGLGLADYTDGSRLNRQGLVNPSPTLAEGLPKGSVTPIEENRKELNRDLIGKGGTGEKPKPPEPAFDFEAIYREYPRKPQSKQQGLERCAEQIHTQADYDDLLAAVRAYAADCEKAKRASEHTKLFASFLGTERSGYPWRDWIPEAGSDPPQKKATGVFKLRDGDRELFVTELPSGYRLHESGEYYVPDGPAG